MFDQSSATSACHEVLFQRSVGDSSASIARGQRPGSATSVLHLVDTLNVGGTETQMAQTALLLQSRQHKVTVGCLRAQGPLLDVLQEAGIPIVEFRKDKRLLSFGGVLQMLRLAAFLRRKNIHVMHAHDLWADLLGAPAARLAGTPVVITSRRYLEDLEWHTPWRNKILGVLYRQSTFVVANSMAVRTLLVGIYGLSPAKVRVIHNGVDVDRFARVRRSRKKVLPTVGEDSKVIAVVANMYGRVKGHAQLVAAAGKVCHEMPRTIFLLVGDGQERPRIEQLVTNAGLQKNFMFLGRRRDIPELLACCDLFVLPSEAEAMPNALLEAMAAGLPVVATDVGGSREVIEDGISGLLVRPRDSEAMAAGIIRILQNPPLAAELARAGQERVRTRFSLDRLITQFEWLYQRPRCL
jgi:glycosyltransferase involved in cell wall biosynthesis